MKFANWFRNVATGGPRRRERKRRLKRELLADLCITPLETRRVLNGDGITSELVVDAGEAADDGHSDAFHVEVANDQVHVSVNGNKVASGRLDQVQSITIVGSSDDDSVVADLGEGLLAGLDLKIEGSGGVDSLRVISQQHIDSLIHTLDQTGTSESVIQFSNSAGNLRYGDVEQIRHDLSAGNVTLQLGDGSDEVRVGANLLSGVTTAEIRRLDVDGHSVETLLEFTNPEQSFVIDADDDASADRLTLTELGQSFDADFLFRGDSRDVFVASGHTDIGTGNLEIDSGKIRFDSGLSSHGGSIRLSAFSDLTLAEESVVDAFGGRIELEGASLQIDGTVRSQGGMVHIDSGEGGTTLVRGLIDVSDHSRYGIGGSVNVLGMQVAMIDHARIDASGTVGGGHIQIGGAFQGSDPLIRNAEKTSFGANASVNADAIQHGDGGTIILWADQWTRFAGSLSARGGSQSGNGGFVEVSGKQTLDFRGRADLSSSNGIAGTLLLDPRDITIGSDGTDNGEFTDDDQILFDDGADDDDYLLQPSAFQGLSGQIIIQATRNITVDSAITLSETGSTLRLQAGNDIEINAAITGSDGNHIFLEADSPHHTGGADGSGTLTIGDVAINSAGGDITLIAAAFEIDTDTDGDIVAGAGDIYLVQSQGNEIQLGGGGELLGNNELESIATSGTFTIGRAVSGGTDSVGTGASTITASAVTVDADITITNNVSGTLAVITSGQFTTENNDVLTTDNAQTHITANVFENAGGLDSKTKSTTIVDVDGSGINLGDTTETNDINISKTELEDISATGLILTTSGSIVVDDISGGNSNNIAGVTTLIASGASSTVSFSNSASTFNSLSIQSTNGVAIGQNVTTDVGGITIDADTNTSGGGTLSVASGISIDSGGSTLDITADDIDLQGDLDAGAITLTDSDATGIALGGTLADGVNISGAELQNITATSLTLNTAGTITVEGISAANSNNVAGTLTLDAGTAITFQTAASTFNDIDIQAGTTAQFDADVATDSGDLVVTGDDIAFGSGVTLQSDTALTLDETDTDDLAAAGSLTLNANDGITINDSLTTNGDLTIDADLDNDGTGTLTLPANVTVTTNHNLLDITVDAVSLDATASLDSGTAVTTIRESNADGIGLGATLVAGGLNFNAVSLANFNAAGFTFVTDGNILVDGVTSGTLGGTTTLQGNTVSFSNNASAFDSLDVQATATVNVNQNLTTETGDLTLGGQDLEFAANVAVVSATSLTLDETDNDGINAAGALSLTADDGITLNDSLTAAGAVTINADADGADNDGTFTIASGETLDTGGNTLDITADDIDLQGDLDAGAITLTDSDATGIALGGTLADGVNISGAELQNITATSLTLNTAGTITVEGISAANSNNITGTLTLDAGTAITFQTAASTFNDIDIQAGTTAQFDADVATDSGDLVVTGDDIAFGSGVTLQSDTALTLDETDTDDLAAAGSLTLNANDGITINDSLTTNGDLTIDADLDNDGTGTLTLPANVTVTTNHNLLDITVDAVSLDATASLDSGTAVTTIRESNADGIGLGATLVAGGLNFNAVSLANFNAAGFTFVTDGNILVDGVTSGTLGGTTTLQGNTVSFSNNASAFDSLDVQATATVNVNQNLTTETGDLTLGGQDLEFAANVAVVSATSLTLDETDNDGINAAGALSLTADDGITLNDSLTAAGAVTINADADGADNDGTFTIASGETLDTGGNTLDITADDIDLQGDLDAGAITLTDSDATGIALGGTLADGVNISGAELQNITATSLTLNTAGDITVEGISAANSNNVADLILAATGNVTFENAASTFNNLIVQAGSTAQINTGLTTDTGNLSFVANDLAFGSGASLQSATSLILDESNNDGISGSDALSISANDGITINDSLTTNGDLTINADADANGTGTLTLPAGVAIATGGNALDITVDAVNLDATASLSSGGAITTIRESNGDGIGLGATPIIGGLNFDATSLSNFTAAGFTFETTQDILVDGVTTGIISGATTLIGNYVDFSNSASSFDSLNVQATTQVNVNQNLTTETGDLTLGGQDLEFAANVAVVSATSLTLDETDNDGINAAGALSLTADDGITLNDSLTAAGAVTINADADGADNDGTFTIASGETLDTGGNTLDITADDIDLQGDLDAGAITLTDSDATGIALGGTLADGVNISGAELQNITATSLTLNTAGTITVEGISAANSNNVADLILAATGNVTFENAASTFNNLIVQAGSTAQINTDVTTDSGNALLTGNNIAFGDGVTVDAAATLTLDETAGVMNAAGALTLNAGTDLVLNDSLTSNGILTIDAGSGVFTLANGISVSSSDNTIDITASGFSVGAGAGFDSGNATTIIRDATNIGIGLGLGTVIGGLNLNATDLTHFMSSGFTFITSGLANVDGLTTLGGLVTIEADQSVNFINADSQFQGLDVQSATAINVNVDLQTTLSSENLTLSGNTISFSGNRTLTSAGGISLSATSGITATGTLVLDAADGVVLNDSLTTAGALAIDAGTGSVEIASGANIDAQLNNIQITANDLILDGTLTGITLYIYDSDADGIGLGDSVILGGLNISGTELQNISSTNLLLHTDGQMTIDGISAAQSNNISDILLLESVGNMTFTGSASTFNTLWTQSTGSVQVNTDLSTDDGELQLYGSQLAFASGVTLNSADTMLLQESGGNIIGAGDLTLNSAGSLTLQDSLTTAGALTIDTGSGTLVLGSNTINSSDSAIDLTIGDISISAGGGVNSGNAATTVRDSDGTGIGLGIATIVGGLNFSDSELMNFTASDLSLSTTGSIIADSVLQPNNISGQIILNATGDGSTVVFSGGDSQFRSLSVQATDGVDVQANLTTTVSGLSINADTDANDDIGTFTLGAGKSLISNDQPIQITANSLDVLGTLNSGGASVTIEDSDGDGIDLGGAAVAGRMHIANTNLQDITSNGLILITSGSMTVEGISQPNSIGGTTTLQAASITFQNSSSTFTALDAQADNGVAIDANVTSSVGDLRIDGDANDTSDGNDDVVFANGVFVISSGLLTLEATSGSLVGNGNMILAADDGITLNSSLSTSGQIIFVADNDPGDQSGTLTIAGGETVDSNDNEIIIAANDVDLGGGINSGIADTTVQDVDGDGIGLGDATITNGLNLSLSDVQDITAANLRIRTSGNIEVDGFTQPGSIANEVTLEASGVLSSVSFNNAGSTFNALEVLANEGVIINTTVSVFNNTVSINADVDSGDNSGTLTVSPGGSLSSNGGDISITANDVDVQGSIDSGVGSITLLDSDGSGVGLGDTSFAGGLNLGGTELQNLTSTGLTISTAGNLTVNNISSTNSSGIAGTTSLQSSQQISVANNDSFFNSLDVLAGDRVSISTNLSTVIGDLLIDGDANVTPESNDDIQFAAGVQVAATGALTLQATNGIVGTGGLTLEAGSGVTLNNGLSVAGELDIDADTDKAGNDGNLTVSVGASVDSNNNAIAIWANDLDVNAMVNAGNATVSVTDSDGDGIGFGDTTVTDGLNVSNSDIQLFFAGDFSLTSDGDVTVDGVSTPISITGTTRLDAGGAIDFVNQDSSFSALNALAADGIQVDVDLVASTGDLILDGDSNLISDGNDRIRFGAGTNLQSGGAISLQANSLGLVGDGSLNLNASDGVALNSDLVTSGQLNINADLDANDNAGTLIISSGTAVTTNDNLIAIVANDLDLQGTLDSGTASITIADSDSSGIGLGDTAAVGGLNISGSELGNVSATGLTLLSNGNVYVDNIDAADSGGIDSTTVIQSSTSVQFLNNGSTFNDLTVAASESLVLLTDLTTVVGDLLLDGDADNVASGLDYIVIEAGVSLLSADRLSLDATNGNLSGAGILGVGSLELTAANGIAINDSLTTLGELTINADAVAGDDDGTLSIAAGATVNTDNNLLTIQADDLAVAGSVNSGTATTQIGDSDGGGIGFGNTAIAGGLNIDNTDLQSFVAGALTLDTSGDILVDGMTPPPTIVGNTTLNTTGGTSTVSFDNNASTFNSLVVQSANDVTVNADVTTLVGSIQVDAVDTFSVLSGQSLAAAGNNTSLSVSGNSVSLGSGNAGSESLRNSGTGTISVVAIGSGVGLQNHSIGGGTGLISIDSAGAITDTSDNSTAKINSSGSVTLIADGSIGEESDALNLNVLAVSAETRTSGGIFLQDAGDLSLLGLTTSQGDITVDTAGAMNVSSPIVSQSTGNISLTGPTVTLAAAGDVSTVNGTIVVNASNGNGLVVSNETVFTTHEGQISGSLINASNPFEGTGNTGEPLSDSNREAVINVVLPDSESRNVGIEIDWSEGEPDDSTTVSGTAPGDPRAWVISSVVSNGGVGSNFIHRYDEAPDPNNPSADIDIRLSITEFAAGTIDLFTGGSSVLELAKYDAQSIIVEVATPILPFFFALPETDDDDSAPSTVPFLINIPEPQRTFVIEAAQTLNNSIGTTQQADQRYYVLRIVTFGSDGEVQLLQEGQEYRLRDLEDPDSDSGFELSQLPELFKRLPDDRYRIYMIEGETERLVLDFEIRDGQPIEAQADETPAMKTEDPERERKPAASSDDSDRDLDIEAAVIPSAGTLPIQFEGPTNKNAAERMGSTPLVSSGGVLLVAGLKRSERTARRGRLRPIGTGTQPRTPSRKPA